MNLGHENSDVTQFVGNMFNLKKDWTSSQV